MGSRRTMTRYSFGNGRSSNGNDVSGNNRSSGCSYLSNVRPENRSTFCSVMAHLTEETQPSFVTTLKSKAVSENSNVKFVCVVTGFPVPQITWYKDDKQLDRYCGLPKYEIVHNGENHSLHIHNCTVEDAAIYQASATNSKGIVSCSGVLEVGEMNEFKIHQNYFAKLKKRSENKCRETEGKENQEPLRTISPDRTQRKRRSTMATFFSTSGSTEDESTEEIRQTAGLVSEDGLQEAIVEEAEKKPTAVTHGAVSVVTNGPTDNDSDSKRGKNIFDPAHKASTAHQPKTPFAKKKIKISNVEQVAKADLMGGRMSSERSANDETSLPGSPACTDAARGAGNSEEVMEIENKVLSSTLDPHSRNIKEQNKPTTEEAMLAESPSEDNRTRAEVTVSSQRDFTPSVPAVAHLSSIHTMSGAEVDKAAKHKKENACKDTKENLKTPNLITSTQKQPSVKSSLLNTLKENRTEHVPTVDINVQSKASTDGCISHSSSESVDTPCDTRTGLLRRPCELGGNELSEKETSPWQKKEPVPSRSAEVTQAHTKTNRNDALVNLEPPPDRRAVGAQLRQRTDDIRASSLSAAFQGPTDERTQNTRAHSRDSNESRSVLFTNLQGSPLKSAGGGEDTPGYNVSPAGLQSPADTAIKSIEGTEIQVVEKVEGYDEGKCLIQADSVNPSKKVVEMETETTSLHLTQRTKTETVKKAGNKRSGLLTKETSHIETKKTESVSRVMEKTNSELQKLKVDTAETAALLLTKTPENVNTVEQIQGFKEIPKPVTKVISIAELLRSQLKSLESTLTNSVSIIPVHTNLAQDPITAALGVCQELKDNTKQEEKTLKTDSETGWSTEDPPPSNIKVAHTGVYQELNKTKQEQIKTSDVTLAPVQVLPGHLVIPDVSLRETGKVTDTKGLHGNVKKVVDISLGVETSAVVPLKDSSVVPNSGIQNVKHSPPSPPKDRFTIGLHSLSNLPENVIQESQSPLTVTHVGPRIRRENAAVLEHTQDEPVQGNSKEINPEINLISTTEKAVTDINMKTEEQSKSPVSFQSVQKYPAESESNIGTQQKNVHPSHQESSMVKEVLRSDSFATPTPESSPLLKKRNNISPIPSATPQELASGARRKILLPKASPEEAAETTSLTDAQTEKKEVLVQSSKLSTSSVTLSLSPGLSRRSALLQPHADTLTSPVERRSPLLNRRKAPETLTVAQPLTEKIHAEEKPVEKDKHDQFKAPQVIRKIRGTALADGSGHLKLWFQFFNVLSDSTIKWYKNEEEIAQVKRKAGDETQANLAVVQASSVDSGVYGCSITNEYGTADTDFLLSADILAGMYLREDLSVGEEIEMTPLIFTRGLADSGVWANKFFGRIMMTTSRIGDGCSHKVWRAKVIYGLEPVFESGNTCIIKVRSLLTYGGKEDSGVFERNLETMKQVCKIQNLAREYCKVFAAEGRVLENFGPTLEVVPVYLMYRPANAVPYATVEADLPGVYKKYSVLHHSGRLDMRTGSEVEQKCCTLQHWIFQWTNGNLLLTRLEGVDTKITNVGISVKSTGHQGLPVEGNPKVFEQFVSQHKCNYFCGLLGLRSLKVMDSLSTPSKPKGSKSPSLQRRMAAGSSSPQSTRKAAGSPRLTRKAEQDRSTTPTNPKPTEAPGVVKMP
ncbi:alpha-protein kinase 3 [Cololabis saira]|uniref:alpha-protein kinase 3 n=1 Tax=Cololabis saira TaxID=129043 RepID=UPI002AD3C11D|nr:alpha-protein kinase 3 [Cololabis saira]